MKKSLAQIRVKRAHEKPFRGDGLRILVDRLWPRGLSKDHLQLDAWLKEIAPSHELRRWFGHDPQKWDEFKQRYFEELEANADAVQTLRGHLKNESVVTFVFGSKEEKYNNAVALQSFFTARS